MDKLKAEYTHFSKNKTIKIGDNLMDLTKPKIFGILNATPDSFYEKSRTSFNTILKHAENLIQEGADVIDIGGFSTRPNALFIDENEEISRVIPIVRILKKHFPNTPISLDTFRGRIAEEGLNNGVEIINDISGFQYDHRLIEVLEKFKPSYILTHAPETFEKMHLVEKNEQLFRDMIYYFTKKSKILNKLGISDIILDPGFGFGKSLEQNYELLHNLEKFHLLPLPIMVGISRKSMITKKLQIQAEDALNGTTILNVLALQKGASFLRVHDVKAAKECITLLYDSK